MRRVILLLILMTKDVLSDNDNEAPTRIMRNQEDAFNNELQTEEEDAANDTREGRARWSFVQSPIIEFLLMTPAVNYKPKNKKDLFDFLRDSYPLPGGLKAPYSEYDFVIVGAGSAGSVLAARLTENKNTTVLVLEAGKPEMFFTDVPALAPYFQGTDYVWHYYMEPQPGVCMGMINERCFWPRGKAVGGSSVVNYMIYTHGRREDWNRIASDGNYGWSYEEVLKYYKKSERADLRGYENEYHRGKNGELDVTFVPIRTKLVKAFLKAGEILGHETIDYNTPEKLGFGYVQVTIKNGRRVSAAKTFLHKHKKRKNLHIMPETRATKILIDTRTRNAYGVQYTHNKRSYTVRARKEVILSAGPIASPQLLMLSGIGPQDHLSSHGISIVKDLPVGRVLYDHITFPGAIFTLNQTGLSLNENVISLKDVIEWTKNGDAAITSPGGVEGIGYIKTHVSKDTENVPDIELISIGGSLTSDGGPTGSKAVRRGMRIDDTVFQEAFGSIDNKDTWCALPMLLHPKSVGYLKLKDADPFSHPLVYGNYLTKREDVQTFIAAIRHIQELVATHPFQRFGAKIHPAKYKRCRRFEFDSDEYWECALRHLTATLHHQIATCRMGPSNDSLAIVNPQLQVYGVKNLRVVDTSVIPRTISAHTNAPGIMIGEKAADMIKNYWKLA